MGDKEKKHPVFRRILIVLGLVAVVFIILEVVQATQRKNQIRTEIDLLKAEAEKISGENKRVEEKIAYFESKDYQEKEARDKLNMQNQDENVVVVKPSMSKEVVNSSTQETVVPVIDESFKDESNVIKWWGYLFGKQ